MPRYPNECPQCNTTLAIPKDIPSDEPVYCYSCGEPIHSLDDSECDQCDSPSSFLVLGSDNKMLCPFCYQTHLGNILQYNRQYSHDTVKLARGMLGALNLIYEKIKK